MIFGYLSLILCPLIFLLTQNAVHRCSRCLVTMGIKRCFGLPEDFNSPIYHLRLGKCAVVIGRIYAIIILAILCGGSAFYVYKFPYTVHHSMFDKPDVESKLISTKWTGYLEDCSGAKIIENQVHAAHMFSQKYQDNVIEWDGYFIDFKNKGKPNGYSR